MRHIFSREIEQDWLKELSQKWPTLLVNLLDQKEGESLERLQVLSCLIELKPNNNNVENKNLVREKINNSRFLILNNYIIFKNLLVSIKIKYFIRGQRKYYNNKFEANNYNLINIGRLDNTVMKYFYTNSLFYDSSLAQLNGYADVIIPSDFLISKLISYACKNTKATRFYFVFFSSVKIGEELSISETTAVDKKNHIYLYHDNKPALSLEISA
jgi:hypothetical protein